LSTREHESNISPDDLVWTVAAWVLLALFIGLTAWLFTLDTTVGWIAAVATAMWAAMILLSEGEDNGSINDSRWDRGYYSSVYEDGVHRSGGSVWSGYAGGAAGYYREPQTYPHVQPSSQGDYRNTPDGRGLRLLLQHMDRHQRADWLRCGRFHVKGSEGGEYELDDMWVWHNGVRYCLQPTIRVPKADAVDARMLIIQADEGLFLRKANALEW